MTTTKFFLKSKTVWAALVIILVQVLAIFGVGVSADEAGGISENGVEAIANIASIVAAAVAIYTRTKAEKKLTVKPESK